MKDYVQTSPTLDCCIIDLLKSALFLIKFGNIDENLPFLTVIGNHSEMRLLISFSRDQIFDRINRSAIQPNLGKVRFINILVYRFFSIKYG